MGTEEVGASAFSAEEREDGAGDAVSLSTARFLGVEFITGSLYLAAGMGCWFLFVEDREPVLTRESTGG